MFPVDSVKGLKFLLLGQVVECAAANPVIEVQVTSMGANPGQSLSALQRMIEQQMHIMVEHQSLLILGGFSFIQSIIAACLTIFPTSPAGPSINHDFPILGLHMLCPVWKAMLPQTVLL